MKTAVRDIDPKLADLLNALSSFFGIKAVAVKANEEIIYRKGMFEPVRDMQVIVQQRKWG